MHKQPILLFCESPFQANKVDEDFSEQFVSAKQIGFATLLFSYEDLVDTGSSSFATRRIPSNDSLVNVIYRGWMLTPRQYSTLYDQLLSKNYQLINTPAQYQNCHYLPDSLKYIDQITPKTIFQKLDSEKDIDLLVEKSKVFGNTPVIVKDYVKSEKHDWETACFVPDASATDKLIKTVNRLIQLRDKHFNEGIVVRQFVELNKLTTHSKSGMPLTEEYRLFFYEKKLLAIYNYWEEGDYTLPQPDTAVYEEIAKQVDSNFFSMDIARKNNGELIVIELGDGQVAGLPDKADLNEFFKKIMSFCS